MSSDLHKIVTPENIEIDYRIAGIGSRFIALLIDSVILGLVMLGFVTLLGWLGIERFDLEQDFKSYFTSMFAAVLIMVFLMLWLAYFIILEAVWNGQTIGKKIVKIRVRKEQGYAPGFWDILVRNLVRTVDFLPGCYGLGVIVMFLNEKSKRLGDYAAGTIVVKEYKVPRNFTIFNQPEVDESVETRLANTQYPWIKDLLSQITREEYLTIKNLLNRRSSLENYNALIYKVIDKLFTKYLPDNPPSVLNLNYTEVMQELTQLYEQSNFR